MSKEIDAIEALVRFARIYLEGQIPSSDDKTLGISCAALFKEWKPGKYISGDIRRDPETGYPKECMIDHDSNVNTDWTIKIGTVWKAYHSRKKEYALPWIQPTGAHDMYKAGEYMIWTDGKVYLANQDTNYSPVDYPGAWEMS